MTSRGGSRIDSAVATQYHGNIENNKGVPEEIVSIRICTTAILTKECITSCLYSGVQLWILSHRLEGFNPGKSFKSGISLSGHGSKENSGTYAHIYVRTGLHCTVYGKFRG